MTDCQDRPHSTDGAAFQKGENKHEISHNAFLCGDRALRDDSTEEQEKSEIACNGGGDRNSTFRGVDRGSAMHEEGILQSQKGTTEPIAIVGFSMRFPQDATSSQGFWRMLCQGRSAMTEVPENRFNLKAFYHPDSSKISSVSPDFSFCICKLDKDS